MAKVKEVFTHTGEHHGWMVRCPNDECYAHAFDTRWTFNGDLERPTFFPSMLAKSHRGRERRELVCHSFVKDGRIEFLVDCTHALAGKTVALPDWDERDA